MGYPQPLRLRGAEVEQEHVAAFLSEGYAVIRGLFSPDEIAKIAAATDQLYAEGIGHGRSFRHGNLFNQVHWKAPGSLGDFAWHQDSRSRRPASAYRNLADSYVQTGLAIDPHGPESGGMRFIPRSHLRGDLGMDCSKKALGTPLQDEALEAVGLSVADAIDLMLEPGDLALWSPYLVHGSSSNRSAHKRRFYINGYVRAGDCDRGEWAFRGGRAVPLGPIPALVHYEELRERPEPHYV